MAVFFKITGHMKKSIFILLSLLIAFTANGQKRAETKLYNAAIENGDIASFRKFLAKYPESVFSPTIQGKIDSLTREANTTRRSVAQATEIFAGFGYDTFLAAPFRKDNVEYIFAVAYTASGQDRALQNIILKENPAGWQQISTFDTPLYTNDENLDVFRFITDTLRPVEIDNELYFEFIYMNSSGKTDPRTKWKNENVEIIFNLCPALGSTTSYNAMFAGEQTGNGIIEGNCMEAVQPGSGSAPQMDFLLRQMESSKNLVPFSNERTAQKNAISNWYQRNPEGASDLTFIAINENNPIVNLYKESKYSDKSASYSAALVECMQTTLICVYVNETAQYLIVWCEPAVDSKDRSAKYLNTIYFENNGSLVLYYDQDHRMIKERINIPARKKQ